MQYRTPLRPRLYQCYNLIRSRRFVTKIEYFNIIKLYGISFIYETLCAQVIHHPYSITYFNNTIYVELMVANGTILVEDYLLDAIF